MTGRPPARHGPRAVLAALLALALLAAAGCGEKQAGGASAEELGSRPIRVVATTNFISDLAEQIGGDRVAVEGLMGPGVDPHLYKASASDVSRLNRADLILYGGLELEGKMTDLFDELGRSRPTVAITRDIPRGELRAQGGGRYDPHMWFDVAKWQIAARTVAAEFARLDPRHRALYERRAAAYLDELRALDAEVRERIASVPARRRVLVTSHDAFHYLGDRYGIEVQAIQGVSTATEATTADVERVSGVIARRGVKAVFVESSVPRQTIDAVLAAARRKGQVAAVGGELFSDAAGSRGTPEGTYAGMVRHNARAIAEGLR